MTRRLRHEIKRLPVSDSRRVTPALFAHVSPQDAIKYCNRSASQRIFDVTLVDVFPYFKGAQ